MCFQFCIFHTFPSIRLTKYFSFHQFEISLAVGKMRADLSNAIGRSGKASQLFLDNFELVDKLQLVGLIQIAHQIIITLTPFQKELYILHRQMSFTKRSLSPAQIQYLRIGPKAGSCSNTRKLLSQAINQEKNKDLFVGGEPSVSSSLNKIPKLTYGEFQKTVSNFGVLINKNFGNETSVHQAQKFGKMADSINKIMLQEKDKPIYNEKKNALLKKIKDRSDNRTSIKTVYDFRGEKLHATLRSFFVESQKSSEGGLPMPYLRFLINHVNSSRLAKIIEPALRTEGNQIVVEFDRIQSRAGHLANSESKYQNIQYTFDRLGQQFNVTLPCLEFEHLGSNFVQKVTILNKEILETLDSNFDNIDTLVEKYLDTQGLEACLSKLEQLQEEPQNNEQG